MTLQSFCQMSVDSPWSQEEWPLTAGECVRRGVGAYSVPHVWVPGGQRSLLHHRKHTPGDTELAVRAVVRTISNRRPWGLTNPLLRETARVRAYDVTARGRADPAKVWWHRDFAPAHTSRALKTWRSP